MTLKEFLTKYCCNYQHFLLEEQIYKEDGELKGWVRLDLLNYRVITVAAIASQLLKITIDNKFELG